MTCLPARAATYRPLPLSQPPALIATIGSDSGEDFTPLIKLEVSMEATHCAPIPRSIEKEGLEMGCVGIAHSIRDKRRWLDGGGAIDSMYSLQGDLVHQIETN